jgi:hypothetical protein
MFKRSKDMSIPRTNQQLLWGIHLLVYFVFIAAYKSGLLVMDSRVGIFIIIVWFGLWALHAMVAFGAFSADARPEYDGKLTEKPKRYLRLSDDGELVEADNEPDNAAKHQQRFGE